MMYNYDEYGRGTGSNKRERDAWKKDAEDREILWAAIELLCKKGEKEAAFCLRVIYDSMFRKW